MASSTRTVLVTGVGGNVGQGILRAVADTRPDLRLVGTDLAPVGGANHLCERVHVVPYADHPAFLGRFAEICAEEHVDLVLPATDLETVVLSSWDAGPAVAVSPSATCRMFHDKYENATEFDRRGIPFAESRLPSTYAGEFDGVVVKPRTGRGSRGVHIDPADPTGFDDGYVVQQRLVGPEVTTGFYVRRDGTLHGSMTLYRELRHGMTMLCHVADDLDDLVGPLLHQITSSFPLAGSCNVQSIVTEAGLVPFEINGRLSGTTSIRHRLGFRDVEFTLAEWLEGDAPPPAAEVRSGVATRLVMDVVYPDAGMDDVAAGRTRGEVF